MKLKSAQLGGLCVIQAMQYWPWSINRLKRRRPANKIEPKEAWSANTANYKQRWSDLKGQNPRGPWLHCIHQVGMNFNQSWLYDATQQRRIGHLTHIAGSSLFGIEPCMNQTVKPKTGWNYHPSYPLRRKSWTDHKLDSQLAGRLPRWDPPKRLAKKMAGSFA